MNKSMIRTLQATAVLTVLVLLLSINLGQADHDKDRIRCGSDEAKWDQCFDCSLNPDHRFCSWEDTDKETPDPKYAWITFALNNKCELYIADMRYSSTPCSLVVPDNATDQSFRCQRSRLCEDFNPDEPYRTCTDYHINDKTQTSCLCSSAPCSGTSQATAVAETSWGQIKSLLAMGTH